MNRFFLYIVFFNFIGLAFCQQNRVPNGSFEEYSECPEGREAFNGQFERAIGWTSPSYGSPDYLNRCSNSIGTPEAEEINVPSNFAGYQEPFDGDGYALIFGVSWLSNGFDGSEYIQCELDESLKPCHKYKFSMRISLADNSNLAIMNIGILTSGSFFEPSTNFLNDNPNLLFVDYIVDTSNWVLLTGEFVNQEFSSHLTIGFFGSEEDSTYLYNTIYNDIDALVSIYYIDSVSLIETGVISNYICDEGVLMFPNIITPNMDGNNDYLDASSYFVLTNEIVILNRWGNVITVLTAENPIWNGLTSSGTLCTEGNYFYKFSYQWGDLLKEKSGFIQLVR